MTIRQLCLTSNISSTFRCNKCNNIFFFLFNMRFIFGVAVIYVTDVQKVCLIFFFFSISIDTALVQNPWVFLFVVSISYKYFVETKMGNGKLLQTLSIIPESHELGDRNWKSKNFSNTFSYYFNKRPSVTECESLRNAISIV